MPAQVSVELAARREVSVLSSGSCSPRGWGSGTEQGLCFQEHCPQVWRSPPQGMELVTSWLRGRGVQGIWCGEQGVATNMSTDDTASHLQGWPGCHANLCGHLRLPRWELRSSEQGNLPPIHRWHWGAGGSAALRGHKTCSLGARSHPAVFL